MGEFVVECRFDCWRAGVYEYACVGAVDGRVSRLNDLECKLGLENAVKIRMCVRRKAERNLMASRTVTNEEGKKGKKGGAGGRKVRLSARGNRPVISLASAVTKQVDANVMTQRNR